MDSSKKWADKMATDVGQFSLWERAINDPKILALTHLSPEKFLHVTQEAAALRKALEGALSGERLFSRASQSPVEFNQDILNLSKWLTIQSTSLNEVLPQMEKFGFSLERFFDLCQDVREMMLKMEDGKLKGVQIDALPEGEDVTKDFLELGYRDFIRLVNEIYGKNDKILLLIDWDTIGKGDYPDTIPIQLKAFLQSQMIHPERFAAVKATAKQFYYDFRQLPNMANFFGSDGKWLRKKRP